MGHTLRFRINYVLECIALPFGSSEAVIGECDVERSINRRKGQSSMKFMWVWWGQGLGSPSPVYSSTVCPGYEYPRFESSQRGGIYPVITSSKTVHVVCQFRLVYIYYISISGTIKAHAGHSTRYPLTSESPRSSPPAMQSPFHNA